MIENGKKLNGDQLLLSTIALPHTHWLRPLSSRGFYKYIMLKRCRCLIHQVDIKSNLNMFRVTVTEKLPFEHGQLSAARLWTPRGCILSALVGDLRNVWNRFELKNEPEMLSFCTCQFVLTHLINRTQIYRDKNYPWRLNAFAPSVRALSLRHCGQTSKTFASWWRGSLSTCSHSL